MFRQERGDHAMRGSCLLKRHALADKVALPIKTAKNIGRTPCVCMITSLDRSICRRFKPFLGALGHKVGGQSQHAAAGFYVHAFRHNAGLLSARANTSGYSIEG